MAARRLTTLHAELSALRKAVNEAESQGTHAVLQPMAVRSVPSYSWRCSSHVANGDQGRPDRTAYCDGLCFRSYASRAGWDCPDENVNRASTTKRRRERLDSRQVAFGGRYGIVARCNESDVRAASGRGTMDPPISRRASVRPTEIAPPSIESWSAQSERHRLRKTCIPHSSRLLLASGVGSPVVPRVWPRTVQKSVEAKPHTVAT